MFRILQNLEREPISAKDIKADQEKPALRVSPHKNLLFRPSFSNLYTFLTSGFKVEMKPFPREPNLM